MNKPSEMYLDYLNNFITVSAWAEYYEIPEEAMEDTLRMCKAAYNSQTPTISPSERPVPGLIII